MTTKTSKTLTRRRRQASLIRFGRSPSRGRPFGCFVLQPIGPGGKLGLSTRWCLPPPELRPARTRIVDCGDSPHGPPSEPATLLSKVEPLPTEISVKARVQGVVSIRASVDENGDVIGREVVKGLPFGLTEQALKAIRDWKFTPAMRDGQAVPSSVCLETTFSLPPRES